MGLDVFLCAMYPCHFAQQSQSASSETIQVYVARKKLESLYEHYSAPGISLL